MKKTILLISLLFATSTTHADFWVRGTGPYADSCYSKLKLAESAKNSYAARKEAKSICTGKQGKLSKFEGEPSCKPCLKGGYVCATYYQAYCKQ